MRMENFEMLRLADFNPVLLVNGGGGEMKHILSVLFFASAFLAALGEEGKPSGRQMKDILELLENAPMVEEEPEFDDRNPTMWLWNPFSFVKSQPRNKCECEVGKCECCFKLKLFENVACLTAETVEKEQKLDISFEIDDKRVVNKKFNMDRHDLVCGTVSSLPFLMYCFNLESNVDSDGSIISCPSIDFRIYIKVVAIIQFRCLHLKGRELSFEGYKEVDKSNMLVLKAKIPFEAAIAFFKNPNGTIIEQ